MSLKAALSLCNVFGLLANASARESAHAHTRSVLLSPGARKDGTTAETRPGAQTAPSSFPGPPPPPTPVCVVTPGFTLPAAFSDPLDVQIGADFRSENWPCVWQPPAAVGRVVGLMLNRWAFPFDVLISPPCTRGEGNCLNHASNFPLVPEAGRTPVCLVLTSAPLRVAGRGLETWDVLRSSLCEDLRESCYLRNADIGEETSIFQKCVAADSAEWERARAARAQVYFPPPSGSFGAAAAVGKPSVNRVACSIGLGTAGRTAGQDCSRQDFSEP